MNMVILTGANRGLGRELHRLIVMDGSPVAQGIFISRGLLSEAEAGYQYVQVDLGEKNAFNTVLEIAPGTKRVVFINNAGTIEPIGRAVEIPALDIEHAMRVNCLGPLSIVQQLTIATKAVGASLFILNVSSGAARRPIKGWVAYCVSKAAAVMAFDVLAAEHEHVEVLHFDPGVMDTDMQSCIRQQTLDVMPDVEVFRDFKVHQTLKSPQEVAEQIMSIVKSLIG